MALITESKSSANILTSIVKTTAQKKFWILNYYKQERMSSPNTLQTLLSSPIKSFGDDRRDETFGCNWFTHLK